MQAAEALLALSRQIDRLLGTLPDSAYTARLDALDGHTLGQHLRHAVEFLECLHDGIPAAQVDYASRCRNPLYEQSPRHMAEAFRRFAENLLRTDPCMPLRVRADFGEACRPEYLSTAGREMMFAHDHTIHHLALIKAALRCCYPEVQTDAALGLSPSTLRAKQVEAASSG